MPTGISGLSILVVDRHFGHIIHDEGLQPAGLRSLGKYLEHKKPHTMSHRQDQRVACYEHSIRSFWSRAATVWRSESGIVARQRPIGPPLQTAANAATLQTLRQRRPSNATRIKIACAIQVVLLA